MRSAETSTAAVSSPSAPSRHTWKPFAIELVVCAFGFVLVTAVLLGLYRASGPLARLGLAILAAAGLIGTYAGAIRWVEGRAVVELAWRRLPRLVIGALLGAGLVATTVGIVALLGGYHILGTTAVEGLLARVGPSLHSAVWEELAFRGLFFRWLAIWVGGWRAMAVSAVLFGAMHGLLDNGSIWSAVAVAIEAGLLLSMAFWIARDLWLPIGMHFGWNVTLGGVFGSPVSGQPVPSVLVAEWSGPPWMTGGAFGLEASVPAVLVCLFAAAVMYLLGRAPVDRQRDDSQSRFEF